MSMLRRGCLVVLILVVVVGGVGVLVYRNGVHPRLVLWIVSTTWQRTRDFEARVEADTAVLGFPVSGAGSLRFKKPSLYDLDCTNVRIIAGSNSLWVIVPALKTGVRVTAEGMTPAEVFAGIVSGWDAGDPAKWVANATAQPSEVVLYAATVVNGERCWVLDWPSRTGERIGGRLFVSQRTRLPVEFDEVDSAGHPTHKYKVTNLRTNLGFKAEDFGYRPLPGYSVQDFRYDPADPMGVEKLLEQWGPRASTLLDEIGKAAGSALPPEAAEWLKRNGLAN